MNTIGEKLRAARIERGITLQQISDETKISRRYLDAIEACDTTQLPGSVFARNFARQYAHFLGLAELGLKPEQLDEQILAAFPREEEQPPVPADAPVRATLVNPNQVTPLAGSGWGWNRMGVSAFGLFAVLGLGALIFRAAQVAPAVIDEARQQAASAPAEAPAAQPTAEVRIAQTNPGGAANADGSPSETTITISGNGMAVRVVAEQDTWISMSANGSHVFSELLRANQSRTISGVENARMLVGNAGGVKIATDGKDIGPIGLPGQVRVVMLSPEGPRIATPPPAI